MSAARPPREQGSLFDLEPTEEGEEEREEEAARDEDASKETEARPLDLPLRSEESPEAAREESPEPPEEDRTDRTVSAGDRFVAGMLDLGLHLAVAVVLLGILRLLGVPVDGRALAALGIVILAFSFFYTVIPLAFWRATPGMTLRELASRAEGGQPLTFGQATRRWLAGVATVVAAGIPALVVLTGRSLADRWSGSSTVRAGSEPPA